MRGGEMREPLNWFVEKMEGKLAANDHKKNWRECSTIDLLHALSWEYDELERAIFEKRTPDEIMAEAVDVANFAMMIGDKQRDGPACSKDIKRQVTRLRRDKY